jgi:protein-disulfide isomerase
LQEKEIKMKLRNLVIIATLTTTLLSCNTNTDKQIETWIEKNPDKVLKALMDYQRKQQEDNQPKPEDVKANAEALFSNSGSPTVGNGEIKIAYFFDFNCGHCARQSETIKAVLNKNSNVQVIYKNLPVLGPTSELAAKGAIAAHQQNKFKEFYEETYKTREKSAEVLKGIAKKIGLDVKKWEADMAGETVAKEIAHVQGVAEKMKIRGTPFLAIAPDMVFPGRVDHLMEVVDSIKR